MHFTNQKAFLNGKSLLKAFTLLNWRFYDNIHQKTNKKDLLSLYFKPVSRSYALNYYFPNSLINRTPLLVSLNYIKNKLKCFLRRLTPYRVPVA